MSIQAEEPAAAAGKLLFLLTNRRWDSLEEVERLARKVVDWALDLNYEKENSGINVAEALDIARCTSGNTDLCEKEWTIDQMVRCLTGPGYEEWVRQHNRDNITGEEDMFEWPVGVAP